MEQEPAAWSCSQGTPGTPVQAHTPRLFRGGLQLGSQRDAPLATWRSPSLWALPFFPRTKSRSSCLQWIAAGPFHLLVHFYQWAKEQKTGQDTGSSLLEWPLTIALRTRKLWRCRDITWPVPPSMMVNPGRKGNLPKAIASFNKHLLSTSYKQGTRTALEYSDKQARPLPPQLPILLGRHRCKHGTPTSALIDTCVDTLGRAQLCLC